MLRLMTFIVLVFIAATGCGSGDGQEPVACTESIDPGVVLEVRDAASYETLAGSATAILSSATFSEQMQVCYSDATGPVKLCGAFERAGTYDIVLTVSGYEPWTMSGVTVASGVCHVSQVSLTALMSALSGTP